MIWYCFLLFAYIFKETEDKQFYLKLFVDVLVKKEIFKT